MININMAETKYKAVTHRVLVDIDNDRSCDCDIVGLSKTDEITDFEGNTIRLKEGSYIYTYTDNIEDGVPCYIFAEGYVIRSPYENVTCKWWCKIQGEIEYSEDYNLRFNVNE